MRRHNALTVIATSVAIAASAGELTVSATAQDFATSPEAAANSGSPAMQPSNQLVIDPSILPTQLPSSLIAQQHNSVEVDVGPTSSTLSGVRVGNTKVITAGHGIKNPDNSQIAGTTQCGAVRVQAESSTRTSWGYSSSGLRMPLFGVSLKDNKPPIGSFIDVEDSPVPDVGLISIPKSQNTLPFNGISYARAPILPGAALVFMNREPGREQQRRTPVESDLPSTSPIEASYNALIKQGYNHPAIFGGIVLRILSNGIYEVVTGLRSYGKPAEAFGRLGMSGGGAYTPGGDFVGLSNRAGAVSTAGALGISGPGIYPGKSLQLVDVQPVTINTVRGLLHQQKFSAPCK